MIDGSRDAPALVMLLSRIRRMTPGFAPAGPLMRVPSRRKIGAVRMSRIVTR